MNTTCHLTLKLTLPTTNWAQLSNREDDASRPLTHTGAFLVSSSHEEGGHHPKYFVMALACALFGY
jgi:hypothetical protein